MKKRVYALALSLFLAFGFVASSCTSNAPRNPITEQAEHLVTEGRLHKVTIQETDKEFIKNGVSSYKIVVADSDMARKAGNFLKVHLENATGALLPMEIESAIAGKTWTNNQKYIAIGCEEWFTQAGLTMPAEDLGYSGYYIKTVGDTVFINTKHEFGYQHAVLRLLDTMVGYEMYSADMIVYKTARETLHLQNYDIIERPDIDLHASGNNLVDKDAMYGMGFLDRGSMFVSIQGKKNKVSVHNAMEILEYAEDKQGVEINPAWISTAGSYSSTDGGGVSQVCYTGGASYGVAPSATEDQQKYADYIANKDEREALAEETLASLVDTVANVMIENLEMEENKNKTVITFTQEDNKSTVCSCWKCEEERARYDNASAASIIKFMNRVNRKVQSYLQDKATATSTKKRNVDLLFFAYQWTETAPARKNAQGKWEPIDEDVRCDDNVVVYLAPISAEYNVSFYEQKNDLTKYKIEAWNVLSAKTYFWLYQTNFHYYFYPFDSVDAMLETYRLCKENGMTYLYNQGQYNDYACPYSAFTMLKEYIDSKAGFDVNVNLEELTDDFFANYFGAGATAMRTYYKQLSAYMDDLQREYPSDYNGNVYAEVDNIKFWKYGTLNSWYNLIQQALTAIESCKTSDPVLYQTLYEHITRESLFVRFVLLEKYSNYYSSTALQNMRLQFKADCEMLNVAHIAENNGEIENLWLQWGI